jgi:hypothetical protein
MARNQRGGRLDQSTRDHLSALDAFIQAEVEASKPRQEGEFTLDDYRKKMEASGIPVSDSTSRRRMMELVKSGTLALRKSSELGNTIYYRFL